MSGPLTKLDEVAEICGGSTPSRQVAAYFGGGICWATPTDVTALDSLYIYKTKESLTQHGLDNSSAKLMPAGAVLLTSRATIGFTTVSKIPICTNQGFVNFICGPKLVPEYLAFWLRTQKAKMLQQAGGTTFKEIGRGALRKFEIPLPTIAEQTRVVDLLMRAESIVRLRREAQLKAAELVPAIFRKMFGDPESNPRGLQLRKVSDFIAQFQGGKNIQAGSEDPTGLRILKVSAVTSGRYLENESKPAPDNYVPPTSHFVKAGDMLFSRANTVELVGATALVEATDGKTLLPDKLWRIIWSEDVDVAYMHALFQDTSVRRMLGKLATGTSDSMRNISQSKLFELVLPIAPIKNQQKFGALCSQATAIFSQQAVALERATATFDSLMARSFSSAVL